MWRLGDGELVAVHTETTQLERFQTTIQRQEPVAQVTGVQSPLIFVQRSYKRQQPTTGGGDGGGLFQRMVRLCGHGRIRAHRVYSLQHCCANVEWIVCCNAMQSLKAAGAVFRVVGYPSALQTNVTSLLQQGGFSVHPTTFSHELHVVFQPQISCYFAFGMVEATDAAAAADDAVDHMDEVHDHRGAEEDENPHAWDSTSPVPCRAFYKMQESLQYVPLRPGDRVLDVGASPGGWTHCLVSHGAQVVAVDPGELTIDLRDKPVVHLRKLLEDAMAHELPAMSPFHMCVCDINVRVGDMALLMLQVASLLLPGAPVVFTLKLGKKPTPQAVQKAFGQAKSILKTQFCDFRLVWLHANTFNERTLMASKIK